MIRRNEPRTGRYVFAPSYTAAVVRAIELGNLTGRATIAGSEIVVRDERSTNTRTQAGVEQAGVRVLIAPTQRVLAECPDADVVVREHGGVDVAADAGSNVGTLPARHSGPGTGDRRGVRVDHTGSSHPNSRDLIFPCRRRCRG